MGDYLTLDFKNAISNITATQFLVTNNFFLPGLSANHSLVFDAAFQQRDKGNNGNYSNDFPFARGYDTQNLYQMYKLGVNYHFPLFYPDAGVSNLMYFLRVRGNLFYDYMHGQDFYNNGTTFNANFRSAGAEVFFDTSIWNQVPLTFGIRYSHLFDSNLYVANQSNVIALVFPLSVF